MKLIEVKNPETRGRISTRLIASRRPENCWVSATDFSITNAAVIGGPLAAGAAVALASGLSQALSSMVAAANVAMQSDLGLIGECQFGSWVMMKPFDVSVGGVKKKASTVAVNGNPATNGGQRAMKPD
ncbi:hypothetical protein RCH09_003725 [Actimicrobium sp. GrIS 1.19]|nr:hypothetical protein [Actimicrobium sp. GrIS 1.19]